MATKLLRSTLSANAVKSTNFSSKPKIIKELQRSSKESQHLNAVTSSDGITTSILANNATVLTMQPQLPLSSISLIYKSGSRYEHADNAGVSQLMRLCAGLRTKSIIAFMHTRSMQQVGATIHAIGGRESIQYTVTGIVHDNPLAAWTPISEIGAMPLFRHWEVEELMTRVKMEKDLLDPAFIAMDNLHRAAYQAKGLGRSIIAPDYMLDNITAEDLMEFHALTHSSDRLSIVGVGCHHEWLEGAGGELLNTSGKAKSVESVYRGGEIHVDAGNRCAYVGIVGNGASIGSQDAIELLVAQFVLGGSPTTKFGVCPSSNLTAMLDQSGGSGEIFPVNVNYSDAGLFGFFMIIEPRHVDKAVRDVFSAFKNLEVTEEDVESAKKAAKFQILSNRDHIAKNSDWIGMYGISGGNYISSLDQCEAIDKVTVSSVQKALQKVQSSKMTMSAYGNIDDVPYLDFL